VNESGEVSFRTQHLVLPVLIGFWMTCILGGMALAQDAGSKIPANGSASEIPSQALTTRTLSVVYEDGELTINAENASLTDVLAELRKCMGAQIEFSGAAGAQKVWANFGPGPARKVLSDLLNGTEFNYVIQGSATDPNGIRSVALTPHSKSSGPDGQGVYGGQSARLSGKRSPTGSEENSEPDTVASSVTAVPATTPADPTPATPDLPTPSTRPISAANQPIREAGASPTPIVGSPDQMAQQLQSMYQQRRQIQINENQQNPTGSPQKP